MFSVYIFSRLFICDIIVLCVSDIESCIFYAKIDGHSEVTLTKLFDKHGLFGYFMKKIIKSRYCAFKF